MRVCWALIIAVLLVLCSCSNPQPAESVPQTMPASSFMAEEAAGQTGPDNGTGQTEADGYKKHDNREACIPALVGQLAKELGLDSVDGEAAIRKAYRYIIENIYFSEPVGLDVWRYLCDEQAAVSYIENRSISPLLFKTGSCEDFAAVTVMLLNAAGFEAQYVAGYTISVDKVYVDHAWVVVKLDGHWYHLDPQLEQNVLKNNLLTYRYYLKSDDAMQADHKWGENLIAYWSDMPEAEKENIMRNYLVPGCGTSFAPPAAESARKPDKPNMADIEFEIAKIKKQSGKILPPIVLNVEPPVLVKACHITPPLLEYPPELYESANNIITKIPEGAAEFERALFIHDYLAKNVEYDKVATGKNSGNAYGAIVERLANCDGYAQAFNLLCEWSGLESMYISGKSNRGVRHAWNAVLIDGLWYYADVTWDRPQRNGDGVYHDYFLLGFDEFSLEHVPDAGQSLAPRQSAQGNGAGYYERKGYFVREEEDRTRALAEAFFIQLEDLEKSSDFSGVPEPVFLELKVLDEKQNYLDFKEHYIKNAFNILKEMQELANERVSPFKIIAESSVRCDFNDASQVFTFYPKVQRL